MAKKQRPDWRGFVRVTLSQTDIDAVLALAADAGDLEHSVMALMKAGAALGYNVGLSFGGYNWDYVASVYGATFECPNPGRKLTAEGKTAEMAWAGLIVKLERYRLDEAWPEDSEDFSAPVR